MNVKYVRSEKYTMDKSRMHISQRRRRSAQKFFTQRMQNTMQCVCLIL